CWAVALYAAMCVGQSHGWLAYYPFLPHLGAAGLHTVPQHVVMVVVVLALAVLGTLYFTDRIGKVLDQRENMLIRANAALEQSRQAIHDLQVRRSRFMQTAAHQLKSPLAMVQTLTNLIRDGIVTDEDGIRTTCDKIIRRSREGTTQVTELLALARVQEADPQRHRESHTDVAEVVTALCGKHEATANEKEIDL
ncbi:MAG: HAMP domain-containing histidine kinase, partial [bacterium]|nr:HAMP domain-containing histidine kinase [bacterium]